MDFKDIVQKGFDEFLDELKKSLDGLTSENAGSNLRRTPIISTLWSGTWRELKTTGSSDSPNRILLYGNATIGIPDWASQNETAGLDTLQNR